MVFRTPGGLGCQSRGQDSAYWMEAAVQPEFPQQDCATKLLGHEDALRREHSSGMLASETLTRRRECVASMHGLSIDTIELYERNSIDELALRLVHGELPVGS